MAAAGGLKRLTYNGFTFGDHGVIASLRAPKNSYSGLDAVIYADGNLGPRCGLAEITGEGIPTGTLTGLGYYSLSGSAIPDAWFAVGAGIYRDPTAPVLVGNLDAAPTRPLSAQPIGSGVFLTSYGDKTYRITESSIGAIASSPGGQVIALFGERLLVAGTAANPNRVWYSDALPADGASATFPALSYFDVGRGASIVGLWVMRNLVHIALDDGSWWIYSGVPGVSDVLRLAYVGQSAPAGPMSGAVVGANSVWFVARDEHFPSYWNGSTVNTFDDQDTGGRLYGPAANALLPPVSVMPIARRGDMLCLAGAGLTGEDRVSLLLREERWSRHSVFPPVATPVPGGGGLLLMSDGGSASAAPRFYLWQATGYDRPPDGSATRPTTDPGLGPVTASIAVPEYAPDTGAELLVRAVTVDLRVYDKAAPETLLRLPGQAGNYASTPDIGTLDITGDLDLRVQIGPDDWSPPAVEALLAKWTATGNQRSYRLSLTAAGALELEWSTDGTAVTTKTSTANLSSLAAGTVRWVRATLDVDNGSAGNDVKFYTSPDGLVWTQLGTTVTTAGTTSIYASTAVLEIGSADVGTGRLFTGNVYAASVRSGIDGTEVALPDLTHLEVGTLVFTDGVGRVWTVNQSGSLTADVRADSTQGELRPINGLALEVEATRLRGSSDTEPSTPRARPILAANGSAEGRPLRVKEHFGEQGVGAGFVVRLDKIRGVAVEQVQVEFEEMAATP